MKKELNTPNDFIRRLYAEEMFNTIIEFKIPEDALLLKLYDSTQIDNNKELINEYFERVKKNIKKEEYEIITPQLGLDTEISSAKQRISQTDYLQRIKKRLRKWESPTKEDLEILFKNYTEYAVKHLTLFNETRKERGCDLPYTLHLIRCTGMSEALKYDVGENKYYNALWVMHDSIEDLLHIIKKPNKKRYQVNDIYEFLDNNVPNEHQKDLIMLSNISDLILKYMSKEGPKNNPTTKKLITNYITGKKSNPKIDPNITNLEDLNRNLERLEKTATNPVIKDTITKMITTTKNYELDNPETFFEDVKWNFYKDIFLKDLAESTKTCNKLVLYEGKGVIDLFDNFIGRHARDLRDRRKSIKKMMEWHSYVDNILENHEPSEYTNTFKNRATQILQHANLGTQDLFIQYASQKTERQDHLNSALNTLFELKDSIYLPRNK
jgi:hypothetical protein